MANFGIPYMGSKDSVIHKIASLFPKADNFYDVFGGGFSVTHFMLTFYSNNYKRFFFNELIPSTVDLIKDAISGKYNYNIFKPEWVSREMFKERKDTCAYTRLLWSFGNNQKNYLFGKDIEDRKRSLHQAVVLNEFDGFAFETLRMKSFPHHLSIRGRRLLCRNIVVKRKGELERLQQLEQLQQLERLQQLQQLQQLERLQQLQQLEFSSNSYEEIKFLPNSVIYCDPPYEGTASYLKSFDHEKFWNWVRVQKQPVFISEYRAPSDIKLIMAFDKKTKLSNKGMTETKPEKVYGNEAALKLFKRS